MIYLCDSSRVIVRTVNDLIKSPMSLKRQRTNRKHPFPNPKNLGGGNLKKCKVRFLLAGRSGQVCPLGGWAELRHFAGNRFELRCINEPCKNRSRGPDFTWLGRRFLNRTFSIQDDDQIVDVEEIRELLDEETKEADDE